MDIGNQRGKFWSWLELMITNSGLNREDYFLTQL